ncbi:MAG TPA: DRTGG domain-containing protein [Candidatus Atribacteria bacterium]|nr:DRTGG domain-containing protein [Candidatus Atribacteria bacterium]HPT79326.1 DRTGG domain-containing protein [Candidatus Atribacteria bacterium]
MSTKHEKILKYIYGLDIGTAISVRKIAKDLGVSEGTAYRAIKEAENKEYVKTFPRVGTLRVEKAEKTDIKRLTFSEVVSIVDGTVLGGANGLDKSLTRFVIGAMTTDAMAKYLTSGSLLIVGNRDEVFPMALENGCAVLISGGFKCSDTIRRLADELALPVISSSYDTFTIATLINKAISERMIKKEILLVEDIMIKNPKYLLKTDPIVKWRTFLHETGHSRFPVVDEDMRIVGILTSKDMPESTDGIVEHVMTPNPITVERKTTVAYAAHLMIWEGIELLPVVEQKKLVGVINRGDVIKALQYMRSQPQVGETLEDLLISGFESRRTDDGIIYTGPVTPMLLSQIGTASWSAMIMLMSTVGIVALRTSKQLDIVVDSFTVYFVKPVQLDDVLDIAVSTIEEGRSYYKSEICVYHQKDLIAKALLAVKAMKR